MARASSASMYSSQRAVVMRLPALGPSESLAPWCTHCQSWARRDLGGGGVFHEVEERDAADAAQPGFDVAEADGDVLLEAGFGDGAGGDGEEVGGGGVVVGELLVDLVGLRHEAVEDFFARRGRGRGARPRCRRGRRRLRAPCRRGPARGRARWLRGRT